MPIPTPYKDETRSQFISRCVEAIADEYDDVKQAVAICYTQWENWQRKKAEPDGKAQGDSFLSFAELLSKSDDRFVIGGYANVYMLDENGKVVPDLENDVVTLEALDEAITTMMLRPGRRNLMLHHSNVQIGEIIDKYVDSSGVEWRTHVVYEPSSQYPKKGLFIVCEVYTDTPVSSEVIDKMKQGRLMCFSIGGFPLKSEYKCDDEKCWREITKLYLAEVSSCDRGVNQESRATVLKDVEEAFRAIIEERVRELEEAALLKEIEERIEELEALILAEEAVTA